MTGSRPRLLVVDDVEDNRTILVRRLERRGFELAEATGGHAALRLIAEQPFDLVLLDIMMPDLDGLEVLRRVRIQHSASALPVIMVTAKDQGEDIIQALNLGANDYITKPVDLPVALARVQAQLARRQAEQALQRANEELERRVAERTAELVDLNARLGREVEERRQSEARFEYLAHHDPLTGLANRVLFRDHLTQALARAQRHHQSIAVHCLDLNCFKEVNDTLGHPAGDTLLKGVAERLSTLLRQTDTVARLGGDEFAVVQSDVGEPLNASAVAERLLRAFEEPFYLNGHKVHVGTSIGVALFPDDGHDPDALLKAADIALYRAKADSRHSYCFYERGMNARLEARRALEMNLRGAIENDEFELHYQPQVALGSGTIVGCEALIRWRHPERGMVSPSDFIPLAEETGLIRPIGLWALRTACVEATHWPKTTRISVNLSPIQFKGSDLVATVAEALGISGLEANRLELEITESVMLGNTTKVLTTLNQLRELGVSIAMDDFGTGYSSLGYLRRFPIDRIKIDRSFVKDIGASEEALAIVRAVIGIAAGLSMAMTAEGVEDQAQADCLRALGCTEAQGYHFSRPLAQPDIRRLLCKGEPGPVELLRQCA